MKKEYHFCIQDSYDKAIERIAKLEAKKKTIKNPKIKKKYTDEIKQWYIALSEIRDMFDELILKKISIEKKQGVDVYEENK